MIVRLVIGAAATLAVVWVGVIVAVVIWRPEKALVREAVRLVPDTLRLVHRLAADKSLARGARARLWFLLLWLASPIDLIPDFIPVIGYADDAIVLAVVLRSVIRRAGRAAVERHWPGTAAGLDSLMRLCRVPSNETSRAPVGDADRGSYESSRRSGLR